MPCQYEQYLLAFITLFAYLVVMQEKRGIPGAGKIAHWKLPADGIREYFKTDFENGLDSREVQRRHHTYGKNIIPEKDKRTILDMIISQFNNAFIFILFAASLLSIYLDNITEALTIIAILLGSAALGFYQEYKSENAVAQLKKYIPRKAVVIRDGKQAEINAEDLVPGDIILLEIGNIIPADVRLIKVDDFRTDESAITGESKHIEKIAGALNIARPAPHELSNTALMGTTVAYGTAKGVVVETGMSTYFGKTATLFSAKVPESDFQANIRKFSEFILKIIVVMTIVVLISNMLLGRGMLESLLFALAVAVGIAPEMLPAITTITLSAGALKMAEKKVVVKKLATIEDIGLMDVLCMDKTGTLTEPTLELENAIGAGGKVDGKVIEYGLLCSHAHTHGRHVTGNIFDAAILNYANAHGIMKDKKYVPVDDIGFDYERKRMSEVFAVDGKVLLITKGEPESVISVCTQARMDEKVKSIGSARVRINNTLTSLYRQGYSVLAVASKSVKRKESYSVQDESGLILEGFLLFKSTPKKTAAASITQLKELGVSLMLLTGDDPYVTEKLCKDVGLEIKGKKVITGAHISKLNDDELRKLVAKHNVFARVIPTQKVRIVEAVRANGHIVGFMGDGVNDAPALRLADVGISVDTAQDVAREAADIVLTHKSLHVIVDGVREGRKTFGNINKYILNTISANYGNMATVVVSPLFLPFIPLLPAQILLNNFMSDIPLITVSTDNVDEKFVKKPHRWSINVISRFMVFFGAISAVFDIITLCLFYYVFGLGAVMVRTLWFLESLLSEVFITFVIRTRYPFFESFPSKLLLTSSLFITIAAVAVVLMPAIGQYFEFEPPTTENIVIVFGIVFAYCIVAEIAKHWFFAYYKQLEEQN